MSQRLRFVLILLSLALCSGPAWARGVKVLKTGGARSQHRTAMKRPPPEYRDKVTQDPECIKSCGTHRSSCDVSCSGMGQECFRHCVARFNDCNQSCTRTTKVLVEDQHFGK